MPSFVLVFVLIFAAQGICAAVENKEATVTAVMNAVKLVAPSQTARVAVINDEVRAGTLVRTEDDSRVEVTLANNAKARLGANTSFHFSAGTRTLQVDEGVALLQFPPNARGAKIQGNGIGASITGTTVVFENRANGFKFLVLQGAARLYRPGHFGESMVVRSGQMVFGDAKAALGGAVDFDVGRFVKTCRLIKDFAPLSSATLMASESRKQEKAKSKKTLFDTNLVIFGNGTAVSLVDPTKAEKTDAEAATSAAPIPSVSARSEPDPLAAINTARGISR